MDVIYVLKCIPANCALHLTVPIIPLNKIKKTHPAEQEETDYCIMAIDEVSFKCD